MPLTPELVERAVAEISKGAANYEYFFQRLSSPDWVGPLRERGFFNDPPEPLEDTEGIRVPGWLPSQYLVRVAARAPNEVAELILSVDTENERIHDDFVEAAIEMPGLLASQVAKRELKWLRQQPRLYFGLPRKLAALVCHLVNEGEADASFALAAELLRVTRVSTATGLLPEWHGRDSDWSYKQMLDKVIPVLLAVDATWTLQLLLRLVRLIVSDRESQQALWTADYFRVYRPRLEAHDLPDYRVDQALLTALRDAARRVRSEDLLGTDELLDLLRPEDSRLFHRLACFALSAPPLPEAASLRRLLLTKEAFFEGEPSPEYRALLSGSFDRLTEEDRLSVLDWIESGPLEHYTTEGIAIDAGTREQREAVWRIRQLCLIKDELPSEWRTRYEALVAQYGEHEFITSFEVDTWSGPESPMTLAQLEELSDDELLEALAAYEGGERWFGPSREGLARTLSELAEKHPTRLVVLAPRLAPLRPVFVFWTLHGLKQALHTGTQIDWERLMGLFEAVIDKADVSGLDVYEEVDEGRWRWVRKEIANLLVLAFETKHEAPVALRGRLWAVLEKLTEDAEPDADYEQRNGGNNMDPMTLALNTVRGRALQAVVGYAMWLARHLAASGQSDQVLLGQAPEISRVLEAHLDPARDSSLAVRSVYGQYFPWIVSIDEAWAAKQVARIFPCAPDQAALRAAAWEAYLASCAPYDSCFRILRGEYERAAREERTPHAQAGLGAHLIAFYLRGLIEIDAADGLLGSFFAGASPEVRWQVLGNVGRLFERSTDVAEIMTKRAMALWQWRLETVTASADPAQLEELRSFAWWLDCECFRDDWLLTQLESLLPLHCAPQPASFGFGFLKRAAITSPLRVVRALDALVRLEARGWEIMGARDDVKEALRACLTSGDSLAAQKARDVVQLLGALGHSEFRDLADPEEPE